MYWWSSSQRSPSRTAIRLTPSCSHSSFSGGSRSSGRNSYSRMAVSSRLATCSPSRCRSRCTRAAPAAPVRSGCAGCAADAGCAGCVVTVCSQDGALVHDCAVGGAREDQVEQRAVGGVQLGRGHVRVAHPEGPELVALVLAEQCELALAV